MKKGTINYITCDSCHKLLLNFTSLQALHETVGDECPHFLSQCVVAPRGRGVALNTYATTDHHQSKTAP